MSITVLVKINKLNNWSSKMKVIYKVEVDEDGNTFWYNQQGKFHREGKPAIEYADGDKVWWVNGKQHREGGLPAVERADGTKVWFVNGQCHREGGLPAIERANGNKEWWVNGQCHREGGLPAIEYADGDKEWWVNGHHVTEDQAKDMFNKPASCAGKVVEIDGKQFKLEEIT